MKLSKTKRTLLAIGCLAITVAGANAATDTVYGANDLLLFFQNPAGTTGTDQVVTYSLGSTYSVFRDAATPSSDAFGSTISLGNINDILVATYGNDWTNLSSSIFAGAAGQNGNVSNLSSQITNGDYARTVYVTKVRNGAGQVGESNSASVTLPTSTGNQSSLANNISAGNAPSSAGQPIAFGTGSTLIDNYNPFSQVTPSTAYGQLSGGIMGSLNSATYALGSVSDIVLALDLYRATPVTTGATAWQNAEEIDGVTAREGYYLGTVTVSSNGDVNFIAVPEPSTYALLAIAGVLLFIHICRRKANA